MSIADIPSDASSGAALSLVVPLALQAVVLLWGWTLRRRVF